MLLSFITHPPLQVQFDRDQLLDQVSLLQQEVDAARHSSVDKEDELRLQRGAFDLTKTELEVRCGEGVLMCARLEHNR